MPGLAEPANEALGASLHRGAWQPQGIPLPLNRLFLPPSTLPILR
jgi:hypothetical protein